VVIGCGHIVESWRKALTTKLHFRDRDLESRDALQQEFATCEMPKCRNAEKTPFGVGCGHRQWSCEREELAPS
jgi:hypothetical protein